jgi:pimeloyl-ACP methyl ester carboxylesterase
MLLGCAPAPAPLDETPGPYRVDVETGERGAAGARVRYSLFVPAADENLPAPPFPAVILTHGFARSQGFHHANARYLASRGIIVLTPNMLPLSPAETSREANIDLTVDHVRWLRARAADPADPLGALLDPSRIALAGHSAGGAVSFEAAARLATANTPIAALVLLDPVPWSRTLDAATDFPVLPLFTFRADPSDCNRDGSATALLAALPFAVEDVLVVGGSHCDAENPTDSLCRLVCPGSGATAQATFQLLLRQSLGTVLEAADVAEPLDYAATLDDLEERGEIMRSTTTPVGGG